MNISRGSSTCCIIKPHAVRADLTEKIVYDIQRENFNIKKMVPFNISKVNCQEFYDIYKGVVPFYEEMVGELNSGTCVGLEITHNDPKVDVVSEFRKLCGPMDSELAKEIRPNSLRAKYGLTKIQNAVHCSDLHEESVLEVEYLFKILLA
ncbi:nucleoside diphosphate kinase 7 [Trichogramma pretiosum]|uniref:nucleoside diphosphate kinase 7 n=1 Tax=Trichogramma pretiosum TaxID=7493 RepID=UPI0006C96F9D|nr:nucleoside diphosphate kinase 7 [Trichogramma pretiosum]